MRVSVLAAGTVLLGAFTLAQAATVWEYTKKADPLRNQTVDVFVLKGSFVTSPRTGAANPSLVIACTDGKVHQNFFNFGTAVHYEGGPGTGTWAHTNLKANIDGKRTGIYANHMSEDGQAAYFTRGELKNILKAHHLAVGAREVIGGELIAEFDIPDPAPIFEKCGKDSAIR
jgi:hypothetical protein